MGNLYLLSCFFIILCAACSQRDESNPAELEKSDDCVSGATLADMRSFDSERVISVFFTYCGRDLTAVTIPHSAPRMPGTAAWMQKTVSHGAWLDVEREHYCLLESDYKTFIFSKDIPSYTNGSAIKEGDTLALHYFANDPAIRQKDISSNVRECGQPTYCNDQNRPCPISAKP